ncbi:MAG TPA: epoxide hydrolase [Burkholderiaceae bacterium]
MLPLPFSSAWRTATAAVVSTALIGFSLTALPSRAQTPPDPGAAIRPFRIDVPEAALADLRSRVNATRWPDMETVADDSQGLQLAKVKALVQYWGTAYDWRKTEARLNTLPQFVTTIDGLDIHFIHVKSRHPNAMPLIITHGWPGSFLEMVKAIEPLTNPTAFGGRAEDAFDVVIPSIPGYGFSSRPTQTGWGPERIARAWDVLMKRLGYARYVSQGGDHGSVISDAMARQSPAGLLGIHLSMPPTLPADVVKALNEGGAAPAGLSPREKSAFDALSAFFSKNAAYGAMMVTRPQTLGYGLTDSPAGMAAWMYDKITQWTYSGGVAERSLTRDEILDDITLYWLTNTSVSAARFYWENNNNNFSSAAQRTSEITIPVAVTVFPGEIYRAPETWTRRAYRNLVYFHEVDKGGHFAAWEEPLLFTDELRAAFRSLR